MCHYKHLFIARSHCYGLWKEPHRNFALWLFFISHNVIAFFAQWAFSRGHTHKRAGQRHNTPHFGSRDIGIIEIKMVLTGPAWAPQVDSNRMLYILVLRQWFEDTRKDRDFVVCADSRLSTRRHRLSLCCSPRGSIPSDWATNALK